jgi:zinc protease
MFGAASDSRLFRRIRDKDGLSYGVGSSLTASFFDRAGRFSFNAISAPQNAARVEAAFREELAKALKDGFTAEEIANAKSGLLKAREVLRTSDGNLAYILATLMHQNIWMDNRIEFERRISAVTMEEISAAFRHHIDPKKISVVKAGDFRKAAAN